MGIVIGMASFVTFIALGAGMTERIRSESAALGANLVVTPKGSCAFEQVSILSGEQLPTNITEAEVETIRSISGMTALPFLAERTALQNRPVSVLGVLAEETLSFKGWRLKAGRYFSDPAERGVVVGTIVAEQFALAPGGEVTIRGERLPVLGVLDDTKGKDDLTVFLPLPVAQALYKQQGRVSYVAARVDRLEDVDAYALKIREAVGLGVVSDRQMLASVLSIVGTVSTTLQMIAAVAVLAAAFGIVNTMLTATYERKREIGIMQAMGATRGAIFRLFLLEAGIYGLLGGIGGAAVGMLASTIATPFITRNGASSFMQGVQGGADPMMIAGAVLFSTVIAMLAGLYPAWRAAKLSPVEAISYE
jgi:putative ABC transport system permease protein